MSTPDIVALAVQIPLVGLFIWFTIKVLGLQREERTERDKLWKSFITEQTTSYLTSMKERDANWQAFLTAEKDQRITAMRSAGEDLRAIVESIREIRVVIADHEAAAEKRYQTLCKKVDGNTPRKKRG